MIKDMIDYDETILWEDKPTKWLYVMGSPMFYLFAIIWASFDGFLMFMFFKAGSFSDNVIETGGFGFPLLLFFLIHMTPVWIAILAPILRLIAWKNIEYVLTDRRVYLVSGVFGKDITSLELRDIQHLTVNVNPFEHMSQSGTIHLTPDRGSRNTSVRGLKMFSIKNPYEVYNRIKRVALDVTTDQQYPNQYRPSENPGYQTKYKK